MAEDDRRIVGQNPVEDTARRGGLIEADGIAGRYVELLPVDDGAVAVGDRQDIAGLIEAGRAIDNLGADRQGKNVRRDKTGRDGEAGQTLAHQQPVARIKGPTRANCF